jgi:hypothetical protein
MRLTLTVLAMALLFTAADAQTFKLFYAFNFSHGSSPNGDLIRDAAGNIYGAILGGNGNGVIYRITP